LSCCLLILIVFTTVNSSHGKPQVTTYTADTYGNGHNEELSGKALEGRREQALVAAKFTFGPNWTFIGGHPDDVKKVIDETLRRLGLDCIDLCDQHGVDPNVPIEETVGAMSENYLLHQPQFLLRLHPRLLHTDMPSVKSAEFLGWHHADRIVFVRVDAAAKIRCKVRVHRKIAFYDCA
jgi:hypothetical protein